MKRALERHLGRILSYQDEPDDDRPLLDEVVFIGTVWQTLSCQLVLKGRWQGGALFGTRVAGTLTVHLIAPLGPPSPERHPLLPDLPYLIGWSDSLSTHAPPLEADMDWCGNWISAPDSRLPDERLDLSWLREGANQGLFDAEHPLVVVGLDQGVLSGRAYIWEEAGPMALKGPRPTLPTR